MRPNMYAYHHFQKGQYLADVWAYTFAEWDRAATTEEAVTRANEAADRAERRWNEWH